jgi:hypothetical protein
MGTAATKRQTNIPATARRSQKPGAIGDVSWERMLRAVEKVRERLRRAVAALEAAGVPYAVADGNAVAAWVSRVDEAAVRNTQDVDILSDLPAATEALNKAGFFYRHTKGLDINESEVTEAFRLVTLEALVQMKLTAFRDKDRTHLRDLIDVGLLDSAWVKRLPSELATRLQTLLDTPEG